MPLPLALGLALLMLPQTAHPSAVQALWLPRIFGDHMVLQADRPLAVWGTDAPGTLVSVSVAGASASGTAGADGRWSVRLEPLAPGGPTTLSVHGSSTEAFSDVLIGEVWLGSGQSNMELAMRVTRDRDTELPAAAQPQIRLFTVERHAAFGPQADLGGSWQVCSPDTAKDFSAVAYHFGRELRRALGRPVGLIVASWGGTPGEDWVPRADLDADEPWRGLVAGWDQAPGRRDLWSRGQDFSLEVKDLRLVKADGSALELPAQGWAHNEKPGSSGAIRSANGGLVYAGTVQGGAWASSELPLREAQGGGGLDVRPYEAVAFKARGKGSFTLALGQGDIMDNDVYASAPFDLGRSWTDQRVAIASLKQGGWGAPEAFTPHAVSKAAFVLQVPYWPDLGAAAYNGMVAPLAGLSLRGVLWYQGESNAGRADQYAGLLRLLVQSWRRAWGDPDLAFLVVQLPGYSETGSAAGDPQWARLRLAQAEALQGLTRSALAVALDLGETDDVHPKDKKPVGRRLALAALNVVYGRDVEASGPLPGRLSASGERLTLEFSHAQGLELRTRRARSFEVAGEDGVYHRAHAELDGQKLVLWTRAVNDPRAARYAYADDPAAELYNGAGLPAGPFVVKLP